MFQDYKWLSPKIKRAQAIIKPMLKILQEEGKELKVLDVGCGDGTVSEEIIKLGNEVWGIDKNPEALKEAGKRGVKVFEGDLEKSLPFENNFFDVIWCLRTIEHVYYTEHLLSECHRILKPNGILIITAQNIASFTNRIRVLFGFYPLWVAPSENYPWERHSHPRFVDHMRCFTKSMFKEVLKRAGFGIEKITADFVCFNFGNIIFPPWSEFLGKIFPSFGETLIAKARKVV
nr:methyltransferase domain-containing protein [Candidatus Freyarchaeota archaeon]